MKDTHTDSCHQCNNQSNLTVHQCSLNLVVNLDKPHSPVLVHCV
uniref:Uncharacterized protein n=1 Tax=Amphimedon queenslandica TaxID=400682 RepID=A0A1X7TJ74_AMPQE